MVHPSLGFSPPSESPETCPPPASRPMVPPLRFPASSRTPQRGFARRAGFQAVAAFRPQVFATSRRFAPQLPCGLVPSRLHVQASPFRGFASPGAVPASRRPLPSCGCSRALPSLAGRPHPKLRFRALLPWRIRCDEATLKRPARPIPSWAFPSPGLPSLRTEARVSARLPLSSFAPSHVRDVSGVLLRVLPCRRIDLLSREAQPSRSSWPCRSLYR